MTHPITTIRPAADAHWTDLTKVFGTKGDASRCWCQYFIDPEWNSTRVAANRNALRGQLGGNPAPGLIAYSDEEPVGWVQAGPRNRYRRLTQNDPDEEEWTITCFITPPRYRRSGHSRALLDAAVAHARRNGATRIRAYPVDTHREKKRGDELYTGVLSTFLDAGFHEVRRSRNKVTVELQVS